MPEKKNKEQAIHSSAAEYLIFVASTGDSDTSYEMRYEDENIWLTQKMMATLYDVSKQTISQHIKRIYADGELAPEATVKKYLTVQTEGDRQISRKQDHYNLQMIIAVGFKVNNQRAVQFRKWDNSIVKGYTIKEWVMDDERLKNRGSILTTEYFDRLLEQIREIRLSAYLDLAEDRAERHIPMTMEDRSKRLDLFLMADDREILQDAGKITTEIAKAKVETEFEKYRVVQDGLFMSDFDKYMLELE